ncbi:hypothetical protein BsWGS_22778 [Bradybaena similaris]
MPGYRLTALFFLIVVTYVNSQVTCPKCNYKYDPDSCIDTQECGVGWNDCVNHDLYGCHPEENETCYYCCEDLVTCKIQRDDLFTYVFPIAGPQETTTTTPPTDPPITGGPHFSCPRCTDPNDDSTCTGTQECSSDVYDTCQLQVHPQDNNKLGYTCQKFQECSNQESLGCDVYTSQVCTYCCLDPIACQHQRDYLFEFVFFPHPETLKPNIEKN